MKVYRRIIIITVSLLTIFLLIPFIITHVTHSYHFGKRTDFKNDYYEYLYAKNNDFTKEEHSFVSNEGQVLRGAFYSQEGNDDPKGLLIWVHGMKVSHENYLAEIEFLTKENYIVFAYDNTGTNYSDGDSLKGLLQAPIDLQHALNYIYDLNLYNDLPNILIGHSWGGFSVSTVSQLKLKREVDGIVTLAAFWKNVNVIMDIAEYYVGPAMTLLTPYLNVYENILFKDYKHLNGIDGLKASNCEVLMIHSKDDIIVNYENNYSKFYEQFKTNNKFTFKSYDDYSHTLTLDAASYDRIHDIIHHQYEYEVDDSRYIELNNERLSLIENLNMVVMDDILLFCDNISNNN